jgi:phosphatidylglycerophosphatase A
VFVLDEFVAAGVLLLATRKWKVLVGGLVLYNLLDATKPVARYVEDLPGGLGIVADDFVSAVVATLCIVLIQYILAHFKTVQKRKN